MNIQALASNVFVAAGVVGAVDFALDRNVKKALIIAAAVGVLMYVANANQISNTAA